MYCREADEIDHDVLELTKEVSQWAFPGYGKPTKETVLTGLKDLASDVIFNAIGSITARKLAEKEYLEIIILKTINQCNRHPVSQLNLTLKVQFSG